jgi:hypothetical protein
LLRRGSIFEKGGVLWRVLSVHKKHYNKWAVVKPSEKVAVGSAAVKQCRLFAVRVIRKDGNILDDRSTDGP